MGCGGGGGGYYRGLSCENCKSCEWATYWWKEMAIYILLIYFIIPDSLQQRRFLFIFCMGKGL